MQESTDITRLCPDSSRLCPDLSVGVIKKVGTTTRRFTTRTPSGWIFLGLRLRLPFFRLLHQTPHSIQRITRTGPRFLLVTLGHPRGMAGRRPEHHLTAVADVVADTSLYD